MIFTAVKRTVGALTLLCYFVIFALLTILYWAKDPRVIAVTAGIIVLNVLLGYLDRKDEEEVQDTKT